jgi:hypothetical protein
MPRTLRSFLAVVAGLVAGFVTVALVELLSHLVYPPPNGLNMNDPVALQEAMSRMPTGAFAFVIFAETLGALIGAGLCAALAGRAPIAHAMIIGGFFFLACVANAMMIPHPTWFRVLGPPLALAGAYLGAKLATWRRASAVKATLGADADPSV